MIFHGIDAAFFVDYRYHRIAEREINWGFNLSADCFIEIAHVMYWLFITANREPTLIRNLSTANDKEWRLFDDDPTF